MHENVDVAVIGAGMSGLGAAIELKKSGCRYAVLEAASTPGGRIKTVPFGEAGPIDTGAQWDHARTDSPLHPLIQASGLNHHITNIPSYSIYHDEFYDDQKLKTAFLDDFTRGFTQKRSNDPHWDGSLEDCVENPDLRATAPYWRSIWFAGFGPDSVSASDFYHDPYGFGGTVIEGGLSRFVDYMTSLAGPDDIHYEKNVAAITRTPKGEHEIRLTDGETIRAAAVICTVSVGVLRKKRIAIEPGFSPATKERLSGLFMGQTAKITLPLKPDPDAAKFRIDVVDARFPHSLHVGTHTLSALFGGFDALAIERRFRNSARDVILADREQLRRKLPLWESVEQRLKPNAKPFTTRWSKNRFTDGSYSCCSPHSQRGGPIEDDGKFFAGEAFDACPGHIGSAYRSGTQAANMALRSLNAG